MRKGDAGAVFLPPEENLGVVQSWGQAANFAEIASSRHRRPECPHLKPESRLTRLCVVPWALEGVPAGDAAARERS